MPIEVHLQPKQELLYDLITATGTEVPTIIGGGGAKGGGKSRGTRSIILQLAGELGELYPGIVITVVRRVYRDLKDNHIDPILRENPMLRQYWRAGDEQIELGRKATIAYRYAQNEEDVKRKFLGGYESAIIIVDEAQQFSQQELQWISTAARWTAASGIPAGLCKVVFLFNPGGVAMEFLRRIFWLKKYEGRETASNYAFIHIFGWDNYEWFRGQVEIGEREFYRLPSMCALGTEHLGFGRCCRFHLFVRETKEGQKYNAFPPSIRIGYLLGDFEHFEGQYFAGAYDESRCVLTQDQQNRLIPYWWVRWMSHDWGFRHWGATFWLTAGRVGPVDLQSILGITSDKALDIVIFYREYIAQGLPEPDMARAIAARTPREERERITQFRAGQDVFAERRGIEHSVAQIFDAILGPEGFPAIRAASAAAGSRAHYARLMYNGFRRTSSMRSPNPPQGTEETPLLFIGPNCPALQSAIPTLICDEGNPEDVLKLETMQDDIYDGAKMGFGYYHEALGKAPVEVRRAEVFNRYEGDEHTEESRTAQAMAMRRFNESERRSGKRIIRRR